MRSLVATKGGCLQLGDGRSKMRWRRPFASTYININDIGSNRILFYLGSGSDQRPMRRLRCVAIALAVLLSPSHQPAALCTALLGVGVSGYRCWTQQRRSDSAMSRHSHSVSQLFLLFFSFDSTLQCLHSAESRVESRSLGEKFTISVPV